ncbi:MAG TPA: hypothetical protein VMV39_08215, partial [Terracidiphilus sp.]|nr:hypothetical protein [Terracidiphilus sp.]
PFTARLKSCPDTHRGERFLKHALARRGWKILFPLLSGAGRLLPDPIQPALEPTRFLFECCLPIHC